jgi:phosphatidylinositol-3-phosphatase
MSSPPSLAIKAGWTIVGTVAIWSVGVTSVPLAQAAPSWWAIQTVFVIVLENHNWSQIKGSASAPYINTVLLPAGAHAERYFNPPAIHPSLPNYLWLEAGQNFGILDDNDPSANHQSTSQHLTNQLEAAGISWKAYQEDIDGTTCPLTNIGLYAVRHNPFVYFDDVTNGNRTNAARCMAHVRPYTELAGDLQRNQVPRYNFITPNLCNDMHDCSIATGDTWLSVEVPKIMSSAAFRAGALFITFDEGSPGDGPIAMIVMSPLAKAGYSNTISYTHSSTLRTLQLIFGVSPFLGGAQTATDLGDLFNPSQPPSAPTNLHIVVTP